MLLPRRQRRPNRKLVPSSLLVYYQNAGGIRTKTNQFNLALASSDYHVIAVSETWLRDGILDSELSSNYQFFRKDRSPATSELRRGGGCLVAVKNGLDATLVKLAGYDHLEQTIIRVKVRRQNVFLCCIYIRPNSPNDIYLSHYAAVREVLSKAGVNDLVIVVGDYNLPGLRWTFDDDVNAFIPNNASTEIELDLMESLLTSGMQQVCNLSNARGNILDLAFVNDADRVDLIEPPSAILKPDRHHKQFVLKVDLHHNPDQVSQHSADVADFDFNRCDHVAVTDALNQIDWDNVLNSEDANTQASQFYSVVFDVIQQLVPRKRIARDRSIKQPWWNAELRHKRNILRKARKRLFRSKSPEDNVCVERLETEYELLNETLYREYLDNIQTRLTDDPSSFWSYVKSRKRTDGIPSVVDSGDRSSNSPEEAANLFADFFKGVFNHGLHTAPADYLDEIPSHNIDMPFPVLSEAEVLEALAAVDSSKGPGPDKLPPSFIKMCAGSLAHPVSLVFNRSLTNGQFPDVWKVAAITPIHKSGRRKDVQNYRPISILSCLPKVLEQLIHKRMYAAAVPIISEFQHGFVKKRSTVSNLMLYVSSINSSLEKRCQVDSVYVDFAKAFDKVPHNLAIEKLRRMGFPRWLTVWLSSYLTGRTGFVRIGSSRSLQFAVTSGVPQGSHLGPLIFLLFVNDICTHLKSQKLLYADDLKVFRVVSSAIDCVALQQDICAINEWCVRNGMKVNEEKCNVISFSKKQDTIHYRYEMNSHLLTRVDCIKDLGVMMDHKLTFDKHVAVTSAKAFATLGFLRRNTVDFENIRALKTLYISLVRSILEYAVQVWAPHYAVLCDRLEKVQKSFTLYALRRLPWRNPAYLTSYDDRRRLLQLESLEHRRIFLQRLFVFDVLTNRVDCPEIRQKMSLHEPQRALRTYLPFRIARHTTVYGQNHPIDRCCRYFNPVWCFFNFDMTKELFKTKIRNVL